MPWSKAKPEQPEQIQEMSRSSEERAKFLSGDIFSDIQDRMTLFRFHRAGLNTDQAHRALVIARQIVEEVEEDYSARKRKK
jgi:hypothetical protein